jgi:hypothetical protein
MWLVSGVTRIAGRALTRLSCVNNILLERTILSTALIVLHPAIAVTALLKDLKFSL